MPSLFEPLRIGALDLPNRIVMAPLTRGRADGEGVHSSLAVDYYRQRASAGLIISEATGISRQGLGWFNAPGIWTDAQQAAWEPVVRAVHGAGGRMVLQLWHMGRVSHPDFLGGETPVAPSAIAAKGHTHTPLGKKDYVTPRALQVSELPEIVEDYRSAAARAKAAGFDGVEIHAANGYLLDQFLRDGSNQRDDAYGGTPEKRIRLLAEVTQAVVSVWGPERVGVRVSPVNRYNSMADSDPLRTFTLVADMLRGFGIAYLHVLEGRPGSMMHAPGPVVHTALREAFKGPVILNGGYDQQAAQAALDASEADAVAFGQLYMANPDLVARFREGAPLAQPDMSTAYSPGAKGYTDYPPLAR